MGVGGAFYLFAFYILPERGFLMSRCLVLSFEVCPLKSSQPLAFLPWKEISMASGWNSRGRSRRRVSSTGSGRSMS